MKKLNRDMHSLQLLSTSFPTIASAATEIINLEAILNLPKGTEHFLADLHGESQAFKHVLPSLVNELIALLKGTSILSYIGAVELLRAADQITVLSFRFFEPYLFIAFIYYIFVMILSFFASRLERWVNRSDRVS